jgi:hypothetical protein
VREITSLASVEDAAEWARTALAAKNRLTASDARLVDLGFELRLSSFEAERDPQSAFRGAAGRAEQSNLSLEQPDPQTAALMPRKRKAPDVTQPVGKPTGIDKSVLSIGEPKGYRDKAHLKFVASQPCLFCGRRPCDPTTSALPRSGRSAKVSDGLTVPLCRIHHRDLHRSRDEAGWWAKLGIDVLGQLGSSGPAPDQPARPRLLPTFGRFPRQRTRLQPSAGAGAEFRRTRRPDPFSPTRTEHDVPPTD